MYGTANMNSLPANLEFIWFNLHVYCVCVSRKTRFFKNMFTISMDKFLKSWQSSYKYTPSIPLMFINKSLQFRWLELTNKLVKMLEKPELPSYCELSPLWKLQHHFSSGLIFQPYTFCAINLSDILDFVE